MALTTAAKRPALLRLTVAGPEHDPLCGSDLSRLFPEGALSNARAERLGRWSRLIARCGDLPVAVVTYQDAAGEVRAPDFGLDPKGCCDVDAVISALAHALEIACLAAGAKRVVVMPPRGGEQSLIRCGFVAIHEGCAGSWMEKSLQ